MRKFRVYHFFLMILLLYSLGGQLKAQHVKESEEFNPDKKYTIPQLKEDFHILRTALEEAHSGLYYYSTKEEMDNLFGRVSEKLNHPMTEPECYRHLAFLIAGINDGHTNIKHSPEYDAYLSGEPILMPFKLLFINGKAYLFHNYSPDEEILPGGEVLAINDRPMSVIVGDMLELIPSDGQIKTSKYKKLQRPVYFQRLYSLLYGITTSFKIAFKSPGEGKRKEKEVKGLNATEFNRIYLERNPEEAKGLPPGELECRGDVAILTLRTFSDTRFRNAKISYPDFMKKAFMELSENGIQHLIIDLRDNGGGTDLNAKILVAYLMNKPFLFNKYREVSGVEFSFLEHTNSKDLEKRFKSRAIKNEKGTFYLKGHPNLGEQKPMQPSFSGNVYVLINGGSFSGSGECTSVLHYYKRAVFIGEECGAGYYGNTSGFAVMLTLPNTRLRIRIPMVRYIMAVSDYPYPERGIIPDYPFTRTIEDYLNGIDTELKFVLELIKKQNKTETR